MNESVSPQRWEAPYGATLLFLLSLLVAYAFGYGDEPDDAVRKVAWITGLGWGAAMSYELYLSGPRQLVRVDVAAITALYYLTFVEFIIPQPLFNQQVGVEETSDAVGMVLLGLAALAMGRHLFTGTIDRPSLREVGRWEIFGLMCLFFAVGYFNMLWSVKFDLVELYRQMTGPRFAAAWGRGSLGGWSSFITELSQLVYLIPPSAGLILVWRRQMTLWQLAVTLCIMAFVFFSAFSQGNRNEVVIHMATFTASYLLANPRLDVKRFVLIGVLAGFMVVMVSFLVLEFRNLGFSQFTRILSPGNEVEEYERDAFLSARVESENFTFMVDNNLRAIAAIQQYYPSEHEHLGEEILLNILVRPVPRALWPGKPEKLSVSTEQIMGVEGQMTVASTFVGEGYTMAGYLGIIVFGLVLGTLSGLWNRLASQISNPSYLLLYASGFYWAALSMRSIVWITVGFLPPLALFCYLRFMNFSNRTRLE